MPYSKQFMYICMVNSYGVPIGSVQYWGDFSFSLCLFAKTKDLDRSLIWKPIFILVQSWD